MKAEGGRRKAEEWRVRCTEPSIHHSSFIIRHFSCSPHSPLLSPLSSLLLIWTFCVTPALAERKEPLPPELVDVGITELPGARLPLELPFVDSDGRKTTLGQFFDGTHPVILTLNYSDCPMLCSVQINGLVDCLRLMPWNLGEQFRVVTVSIDPLETPMRAALTREKYLKLYNRPGSAAGWQFLTGREESIKKLAATVGFRYKYIAQSRQFVHAAALILCTPDGRVSRYLGGVVYNPQTLRLSLVEASEGKVGSTIDQFFLSCFHYDEKAGRYGPFALGIMRVGGGLTLLCIGGVLAFLWVRERRRTGMAQVEGTP
jgi:protein SCO1